MCERITDELAGIDLGDKRLNRRSWKVLETLAANPQASINGACAGWAETNAAYRFFDNDNVTPDEILRPHREATVRRMREHPVVIIAQDTTELDYTDHPPKDARCLNRENRFGLYHHVHLALTPDKVPLGVVGTESFDRAAESLGRTEERDALPIEQKESYRWLKGYRLASELAAECPHTQVVSVADREADIYDIYVEAQEQRRKQTNSAANSAMAACADYVIRVKEERCTLERDPATGPHAYHKVRRQVADSKLLTTVVVSLPATPQRAARQAQLEVRAMTVTIKPPQARRHLPPVTANVVLVEEVAGPDDGTRVSWLLITTLSIATAADVLRVLQYYVARWGIEVYFRTLKTGCRVEEIQLETKARLENCLAFYTIIAWRVVWLTYLNRASPTLPCTAVFSDAEWKSVYRVVRRQPLPPTPPVLSEFMQMVAELGGYNNRVQERPAGPQSIWLGLRRTLDYATAWVAFGPEQSCV